MDDAVVETTINTADNFSLFSIITGADFVVQMVMLILFASSVWSVATIFYKFSLFLKLNHNIKQFEKLFWSGEPLDQIRRKANNRANNPLTVVFLDGMHEWEKTGYRVTKNILERLRMKMMASLQEEVSKAEDKVPMLATIGSVSPFIGLFGTVWGIVNSLRTIGAQKSTSLAVVAPHIAEALFATAIGLVAAIPAVMAYNRFARDLNKIHLRGENFVNEFIVVLSHQLQEVV